MNPKLAKDIKRQLDLGITHGTWMYSRSALSTCKHQPLDGKKFDLRKGMKFNGKRCFPSDSPGCTCLHRPIIKGFDDATESAGIIQRIIGFIGNLR